MKNTLQNVVLETLSVLAFTVTIISLLLLAGAL